MTSAEDAGDRVRVSGASDVVVSASPDDLDSFELQTRTATIDCSSGDREDGEWVGVGVEALLVRAGADERATHLLVTGADGYRVCLPLVGALDALLAVSRRYGRDDALPRLVGTSVEGTRSVKRVRLVETVALDDGEDPGDYERLGTDE
jgi:DMSO/TMAO reductase YedYZ molybdopterin-dependent catalytic subunit